MPNHDSADLSVIAAQLVEAACRARDGDYHAAKVYIERAVALLRGESSAIRTTVPLLDCSTPRHFTRGGLAAWQKRRVTVYIDTHLVGRIRVEELAQLLKLSESHFCRAFRCAFGTSAHDYLTRRRIEMAQGLMLTTAETLCAIALRCGLSDQSHFTRLFRRIVGETPDAWRRARRGEIEERSTEGLTDSADWLGEPVPQLRDRPKY